MMTQFENILKANNRDVGELTSVLRYNQSNLLQNNNSQMG